MLPRELLRNEPDRTARRLVDRGLEAGSVERWVELDARRRRLLVEGEELKRRRNVASERIGELKRAGDDAADEIEAVSRWKDEIQEIDAELDLVEAELNELALTFPNLPHESVPAGTDEGANRIERTVGEPTTFGFEPQAHWDLGPTLGILDFERGAKLAGARFTVYRGLGARLERALISFMLEIQVEEHGYEEILPPFIVDREMLVGTGQLPKFEADLFAVEGRDSFLIPTAEVPLTNLHRGEILEEDELPRRYAAYTPCFRAEAGSYGRDVRGLVRQHQFNKVELVQIVHPDRSYAALEELTDHAETVLRRLDLPYRVVTLAAGDMGFAAAKTYDLEVWLPGQQRYREISSCSNCEDFQARRMDLRFRPGDGGKPRYAHTLNGSGLAIGRTLIAILENYQQEDGSIVIPEPLRPHMGGVGRIGPED